MTQKSMVDYGQKEKSNKTFMVLSAIGIIMVVDSHSGSAGVYDPINLLESVLSYNAFFMPMFVFISGYFLHIEEDVRKLKGLKSFVIYWTKWMSRKFIRLVVPYYAFGLLFGIIGTVLHYMDFMNFDYLDGPGVLGLFFVESVRGHSLFAICFPTWFLLALFVAYFLYSIIRVMFDKIWNDYIALVVFAVESFVLVYFCQSTNYEYIYFNLLFKGLFFIPFLQMGYFYRKYIEKKYILSSTKKLLLLTSLSIICVVLRLKYGDLTYSGLSVFDSFPSVFPHMVVLFLMTIMGIIIWLIISEYVAQFIGNNKLINYISNNTLWIMCTHMAFFRVFNIFLIFLNRLGAGFLEKYGFDEMIIRSDRWYHFLPIPQFSVLYFLAGMGGSIGSKLLFDKMLNKIKALREGKTQKKIK